MQGNDTVSTKDLMKEMPFFEAEDFSDDIVQEAVNRLLSVYHVKGYPFAQVAPVVTIKDDLITVAFFIFEGTEVEGRGNIFPRQQPQWGQTEGDHVSQGGKKI